MSISIPIPSGLTPGQVLADVEAIIEAPAEAFLPADALAWLHIGEALVAKLVAYATTPSADTELAVEVAAEQTAMAAAEDAKFGPAK